MTTRQIIYLLLAIAGGISTWYFNIQYMTEVGFDNPLGFVNDAMANAASSSLTMDIGVAAMTGFIWIIAEARRLQMPYAWFYVVSGCLVAFAFAFPLFLFFRERFLHKGEA